VVPSIEAYAETYAQEKEMLETVEESESVLGEAEQDNVEISKGPSTRVQKNHSQDLIIGDLDQRVRTRRSNDIVSNSCFVTKFEPKNVKEALTDEFWIEAMQEELTQFKRSEVWDLVLKGCEKCFPKWILT